MENIFSLKRFWLLVRKHAKENWKIFLIFLIILNIPPLAICIGWNNIYPGPLLEIYIIILILVGGIYTSSFFKDWTHTNRAASLLILPATAFEKIALVLFYSVILFIPVFSFVYFGSYISFSLITHNSMPMLSELRNEKTPILLLILVLLSYTFLQSLFLLLSIWLKKMQFLIALIVIAILIFTIDLWNVHAIHWILGSNFSTETSVLPFLTKVQYWSILHNAPITSRLISTMNLSIYAIVNVLVYLAAYFKLKEKEI
jgi:hypothetical protein